MESNILEKVESTNIESDNVSNKYNNLLEYYKSISLKLILACESSLYKIAHHNKIVKNLNSKETVDQLDTLMHALIGNLIDGAIEKNIESVIVDIMETESTLTRNQIINITFWIIHNFYELGERDDFDLETLEKYLSSIMEFYNDFIKENYTEIFKVISDTEFHFDTNYHLGESTSE